LRTGVCERDRAPSTCAWLLAIASSMPTRYGFVIWSGPGYACEMKREEWDWPPIRGRYRAYSRFDVHQPSGWSSPGAKRAVQIYWRVTITIIKVLFAILLSIVAAGAFWLLWTIITL
jgi:hypothetical protein